MRASSVVKRQSMVAARWLRSSSQAATSFRIRSVAFVGTQVLATPTGRLGSPNHDAVQCFGQQFHIRPVGSADDKRERDASPLDQQTAFGAFFFPDP